MLEEIESVTPTAAPAIPPTNGPNAASNMKQIALSYFQRRPEWLPMVNTILSKLDDEGAKALIALFSLIQDDTRRMMMTGKPPGAGPTIPGVIR